MMVDRRANQGEILQEERNLEVLHLLQQRSVINCNLVKKFSFLEDFDISNWDRNTKSKTSRIGSLVSNKFHNVKPTPISKLLEVLHDPSNFEHQRFLIKGYILHFSANKLQEIVKKMTSDKKVLDFNAKSNDPNLSYLYHFIASLKDPSVEDDERSLNVYILTNEEDQHLFDLWELLPPQGEPAKWKNLNKGDIEKFEKKLQALTAPEVEVRMVVELLITASGKAFFKLYETVFV